MKRPYAIWTYLTTDRTRPHVSRSRFGSLESALLRVITMPMSEVVGKWEIRKKMDDGTWQVICYGTLDV